MHKQSASNHKNHMPMRAARYSNVTKQSPDARKADHPGLRPDADMQRALIAEAAYYRAEKRDFAPGNERQDWFEAEAEIMAMLNG